MSARFWLFSCASAGMALTGGFGLGHYVTTPPRAEPEMVLSQAAVPDASDTDATSAGLIGPTVIRCTGCGPTLADRQMVADMAGWDGMNDPAVHDYAMQDQQADYAEPASQAQPTSSKRFTAGESEDRQPVMMAQARNSKTPAEEAPADAATSY